jgi:hypothetical protein
MNVIIYFKHDRHTDDDFQVCAFTDSNVQKIEREIIEWASDFFGKDLVNDQTMDSPSISIPYIFAMGTED